MATSYQTVVKVWMYVGIMTEMENFFKCWYFDNLVTKLSRTCLMKSHFVIVYSGVLEKRTPSGP